MRWADFAEPRSPSTVDKWTIDIVMGMQKSPSAKMPDDHAALDAGAVDMTSRRKPPRNRAMEALLSIGSYLEAAMVRPWNAISAARR